MVHILLVIIYLAFISLGLPDSLLGAACWPMRCLSGSCHFICSRYWR